MMPSDVHRQEYIQRLNRVINHIYAHLGQPLALKELAEVAGFSPFHFHRIFKSLVGETLGEYIQRARLEAAANLLLNHPEATVISIAVTCGFTNPAAFARAFQMQFGVSPSRFRREKRNLSTGQRNPGTDGPGAGGYNGKHQPVSQRSLNPMDVEIKKLPDLRLAYIRHIEGYSKGVPNPQIAQAFQRVCQWAAARELFGPETLVIGIAYDNPEVTPAERRRYDACVSVPPDTVVTQGEVSLQDLPGGKYALCRIEISAAEAHKIGEVVDYLYGEWLPASGYQADDKPPLEIYRETPGKAPGTWICMDYCIPVKPL